MTRCMHCGERTARRCKTGDCRHCDACNGTFIPCAPRCPGFHLNLEARDGCLIEICDECAQSIKQPKALGRDHLCDADARGWPEAYRAAARLLTLAVKEAT